MLSLYTYLQQCLWSSKKLVDEDDDSLLKPQSPYAKIKNS